MHSYSKNNPAGMGCNAPASTPTHHRTMKAILTLREFGEKVKVVSIPNPRANNDLEFWIEDPSIPGHKNRIFCQVGEETKRYSPVEITDDTPTCKSGNPWKPIKR